MLVSVLLDDLMVDLIAVICRRQAGDLNFHELSTINFHQLSINYYSDNSCTLLPSIIIKLLY